MVLIVNETSKEFAITRSGSTLYLGNDEITEGCSYSFDVAGLDSRLDEIFKDDSSVKVAAKRTTKLFLTSPDKVTTYRTGEIDPDIIVNAIDRKEYLEKTKKPIGDDVKKTVYARMLVLIIGENHVSVENGDGVWYDNVVHETVCNDANYMISAVLIIPSKWMPISNKNMNIVISESRKLHVSYVTINNNGKESQINALIRCSIKGKPIPTGIKQVRPKRKKKPFKKNFNKNGDNRGGYKRREDGTGKKPYKKPYNKDQSSNGNRPWRSKPDNVDTRRRSGNRTEGSSDNRNGDNKKRYDNNRTGGYSKPWKKGSDNAGMRKQSGKYEGNGKRSY